LVGAVGHAAVPHAVVADDDIALAGQHEFGGVLLFPCAHALRRHVFAALEDGARVAMGAGPELGRAIHLPGVY
jgi:hypothetical protein